MSIGIISGASSGIGKELAIVLDSLGLDEIWLIARRENKLEEIKQSLKTKVKCFALDLTNVSSLSIIRNELSNNQYKIEYLALNAGVGYTGALQDNSCEQISSMVDLNCKGLTLLLNICLPYVCDKGKIITIASGAGFLPQADFAVYAATKSYVISLSRAIRKELKHRKISVTAVCPGPVDTEFFSNLENVKEYKKKYLVSPSFVARGAVLAVQKNKAIYAPTVSMKLLRFATKILPTSLLLKFSK